MNARSMMSVTDPLRAAVLMLGWVSLALLPLAATGCGHKASATDDKTEVVEVATVNPQVKDLTREIDQPGFLRPFNRTPIYTKIAGFAKDWKVDKGSRVKKGELLVELRVPEVEQDLLVKAAKIKQAEADLKQAKESAIAAAAGREAAKANIDAKVASIASAEAQVMRWQAEEERSRRLVGKGVFDQQTADENLNQLRASQALRDEAKAGAAVARASFDQAAAQVKKAEADVEVATANLAVAKASYDQWRDWLAYRMITAEYDGVITDRMVSPGDFLQPSNSGSTSKAAAPLFIMEQTDTMRCTVDVPELDAALVKPHDKAVIRFQARPGHDVVGEVALTSESLDERTRTLSVEIHLKNPNNELLSGLYANVTIFAKLRNAMTIPADAIEADILADGDRSYCFMVEDGKVHKTFLQIGTRCDEGVQVLRKQREGGKWEEFTGKEVVVVDQKKKEDSDNPSRLVGPKALRDGQQVEAKPAENP